VPKVSVNPSLKIALTAYDMDSSPNGHFAYWTVRLRDSTRVTHIRTDGQTDGRTELQFPRQRYSRGKNLSEDEINY